MKAMLRSGGTLSSVRRSGHVPAVLYGHGLDSTLVQVDSKEFGRVYESAGKTSLIELDLGDGQSRRAVIRDVQRHPLNGNIIHADFYQIRSDELMRVKVPIHFIGESPAVKNLGGTFVRNIKEIDLQALPKDLPHDIEVDISGLNTFEKVIRVSDLPLPVGVEIFRGAGEVVGLVQEPKSQDELDQDLATEIKEDVESVEGVKEKEEAEQEKTVEQESAKEQEPNKEHS